MSNVTIRAATSADIPRLVDVSLAADTLFAQAGLDLPPDDPESEFAECEWLLLAEVPVSGAPVAVGFAALIEVGGAAHLSSLGVHPDHGRRGVGSALLEEACAQARDRGYRAMTLTTFRDLPFNAPWYSRRGFAEVPESEWGAELAERYRLVAHHIGHMSPRIAMRRQVDMRNG